MSRLRPRFVSVLLACTVLAAAYGPVLLACAALVAACRPVRAFAQPMLIHSEASRELLDSARRHLLAYRMAEAENDLRLLAQRSDGRPAAYFYLSSAALHRALMTDSEAEFDTYAVRADSVKRILGGLDASTWRNFMLAEVDLYDAIAATKRNQYIRAAWRARSAYGGFERLLANAPDFYEAYKGFGILHLAIGSMPSTYRFVLRILGYGGSIAGGLQELETAFERSTLAREEAGLFLALTHTMLFIDERESLRIVKGFYDEQPESILYSHVYGFVLLSNRRVEEAERVLREAIHRAGTDRVHLDATRRAGTERYFYIHYLDFYLAEALFRQDRYAEAEAYYRRYVDRHTGPALKALAYLGLGQALEMQDMRREALVYYRRVQAARDFDTDVAARRLSQRLAAGPMTQIDRRLLRGRNAYDSGRYVEAGSILTSIATDSRLPAGSRAEAAYRLGRAAHAREQYEEAVAWYEQGIHLTENRLDRWAPWGRFFIGKVRQAQGRLDDARESYSAALDYGGKYDYHQALEQSARAALELLDP